MEVLQTYETTVRDTKGRLGFSVFVIPARCSRFRDLGDPNPVWWAVAETLGYKFDPKEPAEIQSLVYLILQGSYGAADDLLPFSTYVAYARIIPFETSPLGAESLATIASSSAKARTVAMGATVGYFAAGTTPLLLITVPLGIVLCGAAVSFAKWLDENREIIWRKLVRLEG